MTGKYNAMLDQMVRDYSLVTHGYSGVAPANPYPMFEEKRAKCPVMHGDLLQENSIPSMADYMMTGRPVVTLYRYNDIHSVLMNPDEIGRAHV